MSIALLSVKVLIFFLQILTNCRTPSLFGEVIRGEHVRIELIQVSSDYKGGKILARFEAPIHSFLFPEEDQTRDRDLREIQLNRSRKYQVCCSSPLENVWPASCVNPTTHLCVSM